MRPCLRKSRQWQEPSRMRPCSRTGQARPSRFLHIRGDVSAETAHRQKGSQVKPGDQEARQIRSGRNRRYRLCPARSRRNGSALYLAGGAVRAPERHDHNESCLLQMGPDLQRSDDDGCRGRPPGAPFRDPGVEPAQLSGREGTGEAKPKSDPEGGRGQMNNQTFPPKNERLSLKEPTGWFAAGDAFRKALASLSDGAFKLFAYLCLEA